MTLASITLPLEAIAKVAVRCQDVAMMEGWAGGEFSKDEP
jgi:hypothetical protein